MAIDREKLRKLRLALGMTQEQAATLSGFRGRSNWNNIEAGRQDVTTAALDRIAAALGVTACDLLKPAPRKKGAKP